MRFIHFSMIHFGAINFIAIGGGPDGGPTGGVSPFMMIRRRRRQ